MPKGICASCGHRTSARATVHGRILCPSCQPRPWKPPPKIKPLDPNKPLAPYSVPAVPAGKFANIPGQMAMDFSRDEWDAVTDPAEDE